MEFQGMDSGKDKSNNEASGLIECCNALTKDKQLKISIKNKLKEIIRKQLMNINELQQKCEESFIAINQLPKNTSVVAERFEKTMKYIGTIQNKQIAVNEILNASMKGFDDVTKLKNYSNEQFESELKLANQRNMIYEMNVAEIKKLSETVIDCLRNNIKSNTYILTKVKNVLKNNYIQIVQNHLSDINAKLKNIEIKNAEVEEESSRIEFTLISLDEKMSLLNDRIKEKENNDIEELENVTSIFNERDSELLKKLNKLESMQSVNNDFSDQLSALKIKLDEEREKSLMKCNALSQEILLKKPELDLLNSKLEIIMTNCHKLSETVKFVSEAEELCTLTNSSLSQLKIKYNNLNMIKENFSCEVENIGKNVKKLKNIINEEHIKIEELRSSFNNFNKLISQAKEAYEEENNSFRLKIEEVKNEINNTRLKKNNSIQAKREMLEAFNTEKESFSDKNKELIEIKDKTKLRKEELTEKIKEMTSKLSNISQNIEVLLSESKKAYEKKEIIESLIKKVALEKEKKNELISNFQKEIWDVIEASNNKQEALLAEYLQMREIKHKELEKFEDELSRKEYIYDVIVARIIKYEFEFKKLEKMQKKINCKKDLLMRLVDCLQIPPSFITSADYPPTSEGNPYELPKVKELVDEKNVIPTSLEQSENKEVVEEKNIIPTLIEEKEVKEVVDENTVIPISVEEAENLRLTSSLDESYTLDEEMVVQKYVVATLEEEGEDKEMVEEKNIIPTLIEETEDKEVVKEKNIIPTLIEETEKLRLNSSLDEIYNLDKEIIDEKNVIRTSTKETEDSSQIKYPPLPKKLVKRESSVSLMRNASGLSQKKKARVEPYRWTILDRVISTTDSQSSA